MKAVKLKILSNQQVSQRYWHMVVDASELQEDVKPGQFFNIRCAEEYYPLLRRPFSIYRINKQEGTLEFLYLVKGIGTQRLTGLTTGERVDVFGPLGEGFTLKTTEAAKAPASGNNNFAKENGESGVPGKILMLARGVGIATLAALAQEASEQGVQSVAIISARTRNDLLAAEALESCGTEVYKVTEEDGNSGVEHVGKLLERLMQEHQIQAAYTCGSKRLAKLLQDMAEAKGIYAEIALEENMGCAMGVCFACVCDLRQAGDTVRTVRVCKEGPVFPLEQVVLT